MVPIKSDAVIDDCVPTVYSKYMHEEDVGLKYRYLYGCVVRMITLLVW